MRKLRTLSIAALAVVLAVPAHARTVTCADGTTSESGRGACSQHGGVAANAPAPTQTRVTRGSVVCQDGTTSTAGRGACSRRGGVAEAPPAGTSPTAGTRGPRAAGK
jgi:hypothetical protein